MRTIFDYTRFTQFGGWSGWIEVDGVRSEVSSATVWGSRDRSWGIRPTGEAHPAVHRSATAQFFWLWAPVNFPSLSTHFDVNEYGDGRRWHEVGVIARTDGSPPEHDANASTTASSGDPAPGGRNVSSTTSSTATTSVHTITLVPRYEFQMSGLGYGHPEFGHGMWKGEAVVASERIALPVDDAVQPPDTSTCKHCATRPTLRPDGIDRTSDSESSNNLRSEIIRPG